MSESSTVTVSILDRDYLVACPPDGRDALHAAARLLDGRLRELRRSARSATLERLAIICRVNGEVRQAGFTSDMIFGVAEILEFVTQVMTLLPGDVVLTGTPSGVGPVLPGDLVEVEMVTEASQTLEVLFGEHHGHGPAQPAPAAAYRSPDAHRFHPPSQHWHRPC